MLEALEGRRSDVVRLADGREFAPVVVSAAFIEATRGTIQSQLVVEPEGGIRWRIVPCSGVDRDALARTLVDKSAAVFGTDAGLGTVEFLEHIPNARSGKFRKVIAEAAGVPSGIAGASGFFDMCGICGVAFTSTTTDASDVTTLRRMTGACRHRGPDSDGFVDLAPGVGMGVRRLAIIDLAAGDQPHRQRGRHVDSSATGRSTTTSSCARELRRGGHRFRTRSDTEVILHLYEEPAPDCVQRLRGMFAFALGTAAPAPAARTRPVRDQAAATTRTRRKVLCFRVGDEVDPGRRGVTPRPDTEALGDVLALGFLGGAEHDVAPVRRLQPAPSRIRARPARAAAVVGRLVPAA